MRNKLNYYLAIYNELIILDNNELFDIDFLKHKCVLIMRTDEKFNLFYYTYPMNINYDMYIITKDEYLKKYSDIPVILKIKKHYIII